MAYYNRRDLIGHWVRRTQPTQRMCQHACCRGKRVHPANMPVILPDPLLKRASEKDLIEHYQRVNWMPESAQTDRARAQVLYEIDRREDIARRREARAEHRATVQQRRRERWEAQRGAERMERESAREAAYLRAEFDTRGNMLNREGERAGIDPRSLFTGTEARARKYASYELLEHWQTHPRPTAASFEGRDTRVYEKYSAPNLRRGRPRYIRSARPVRRAA